MKKRWRMRSTVFSYQHARHRSYSSRHSFADFSLSFYERQQFIERHRADVLGVHPEGLVVGPVTRVVVVEIEDRVRAMNVLEREFLDKLLERIDLFLFAARRPAKQRKKIAKRGGDKTGVAIGRQRNDLAVLALREFAFVRCEDQRKMRELRRRHAESFVDQNLFVRVRQMVLSANDMRDPHLDVVANDREIVERMTVRAEQDKIFGVGIIALLQSVNCIFE